MMDIRAIIDRLEAITGSSTPVMESQDPVKDAMSGLEKWLDGVLDVTSELPEKNAIRDVISQEATRLIRGRLE